MEKEPTKQQLIECYNLVFSDIHSDGFKAAEMKDLIYGSNYLFIAKPKKDWKELLRKKLDEFGIDLERKLNFNNL